MRAQFQDRLPRTPELLTICLAIVCAPFFPSSPFPASRCLYLSRTLRCRGISGGCCHIPSCPSPAWDTLTGGSATARRGKGRPDGSRKPRVLRSGAAPPLPGSRPRPRGSRRGSDRGWRSLCRTGKRCEAPRRVPGRGGELPGQENPARTVPTTPEFARSF